MIRLLLALVLFVEPLLAAAERGRAFQVPRAKAVAVPFVSVFALPSIALPPISLQTPGSAIPSVPQVQSLRFQRVAEHASVPYSVRSLPLQSLSSRVELFAESAKPNAPIESGVAAATTFFEGGRSYDGFAEVPGPLETAPSADAPKAGDPGEPERKKNVALMRAGTASFKLGMEVVKLGVPLYALQELGGATKVAMLAVSYGLAQAVFSSWAGALIDRFPASKVLAGAVRTQAALVGGLLLLGWTGLLTPWVLLPIYGLVGATVGIAETTRKTLPPMILGQDNEALNRYNGSLHAYYEVAGVAGAISAGLLIGLLGPLNAMILQPPAFLLGGWLFARVRHSFEKKSGEGGTLGAKVKSYFGDLKAGVRTIASSVALRWLALAMVLPQIVHRVFEDLMLPVFAKKVLEAPTNSAWMLASSNLGELVGAIVLLKLAERFKGPHLWVKWSAMGLLAAWALSMTTSLPILLPIILVFSASWAASDLSLLSELQSRVAEKELPRALSVLFAATVIAGMLISLALGRFMDAVPLSTAFLAVNAAFTGLAALVWLASRKLR